MKAMLALVLLVAAFATTHIVAGAQTPSPAQASASTIAISELFVIPWDDGSQLACMTFSNASDRTIHAVRFGVTHVTQNPLGDGTTQGHVDRIGSFAPGVAIRAPTRFLGTVSKSSPALQNCWTVAPFDIKTELQISVLKVVYSDGTVWENPNPATLASVTY